MVGAAFAARLAMQGLSNQLNILVVDRGQEPKQMDKEPPSHPPSIRVSTLTHHSVEMAKRCGAWDALGPPWSAAFSAMQVWDAAGRGCIRWDSEDLSLPSMGHVAENHIIQTAFLGVLRKVGVGRVDFGTGIDALQLPSGCLGDAGASQRREPGRKEDPFAVARLSDGRTVRARLVVAADGAQSRVRELAGIGHTMHAYGQSGVTFTVATEEVNEAAWQKFLPTGPLALLPVRSGYSNVVWSTTPDMAASLTEKSGKDLADAVTRAIEYEDRDGSPLAAAGDALRNMIASGPTKTMAAPPRVVDHVGEPARAFPLRRIHAERYVKPRLALLGDAAHAVHPMAGQGVNLGLGDADRLAGAVGEALAEGADYGDSGWLEEHYEEPRRRANLLMMSALDGVRAAFAAQAGPIRSARALGLDLINASGPVKAAVMGYAMGLDLTDVAARAPGMPSSLRRAIEEWQTRSETGEL